MAFWRPVETLDEDTRRRGLDAFLADGVCSQVRESLQSGPLLVGYALLLGVSNGGIGVLAALGPLTQILQLPTVALIERLRVRKAITWWAALASRTSWAAAIAVPWVLPQAQQIPALFLCLALAAALGTVAGGAWTPWMRDFLPEHALARAFARRMAVATAVSAMLGLAAGYTVDALPRRGASPIAGYDVVFGVGVLAGLIGLLFLARIPEPRMAPSVRRPWRDVFRTPLADTGFRPVMIFLACWTFAANLTAPFFTVYLLRRFGLPMAWVVGLTVLSQTMTALAFRWWGTMADRYDLRTVLRVAGAAYLLTVATWPFVDLLASETLVVSILVGLHVIAGLSAAGVNLGTGTLALQVAPRGEAAAYLATNALVSGIAAAIAPILAGLSADWLNTQRFTITIQWSSSWRHGLDLAVRPLDFHGLDFLWAASVLIGLYAIHRLLAVPASERGLGRALVVALLEEMRTGVRTPLRAISTVPGVREVVELPLTLVARMVPERRAGSRVVSGPRTQGPPAAGPGS